MAVWQCDRIPFYRPELWLHRASAKERKNRARSRCFLSREIILLLQYSRGKDSLLSFVPIAMTIFLSSVLISFTSPMKKPCSKQGLQLATAILNSTTQYASSAQNLWLNLSTIMKWNQTVSIWIRYGTMNRPPSTTFNPSLLRTMKDVGESVGPPPLPACATSYKFADQGACPR